MDKDFRTLFENAMLFHDLMVSDTTLSEDGADRSDEVRALMQDPDSWVRNDYDTFVDRF